MKTNITFLIGAISLLFAISVSSQQVPGIINFQGKVSTSEGDPINGTASITFSIYPQATQGTALWSETHNPVYVNDGIFHVLLGSVVTFPEGLFNEPDRWIGINVNGDGEMSPRSRIASTAYAMVAGNAGDEHWLTNGENIYHLNGKVGIGTDDPQRKLDVAGSVTATSEGYLIPAVRGDGGFFGVYGESEGIGVSGKGLIGINAIADLEANPGAIAGYFQGKVGIGTSTPGSTLDLAGGQLTIRGKDTPVQGKSLELAFNQDFNRGELFAYDRSASEYCGLRIDGSNIRINGSSGAGNVSIGTSVDEGRLNVVNKSGFPGIYLQGASSSEGDIAWNSSEHMQIGFWNTGTDSYSNVVTLTNDYNLNLYKANNFKTVQISATETGNDGSTLKLFNSGGSCTIELDAEYGSTGGGSMVIANGASITGNTESVIYGLYNGTGNGKGVHGYSVPDHSSGYGGYFEGGAAGVIGRSHAQTSNWSSGFGVYGLASETTGYNIGLFGYANAGTAGRNYGLIASAYDNNGNYDWSGKFFGHVIIHGSLIRSLALNKIDHPLDPANKEFNHASVESAEFKNIYDGVAVLDENGQGWVNLPDWFDAYNENFRYQLTCIGQFANVYIAETVKNNRFKIAGGKAGMEISWQITGTRKDSYAIQNPIVLEEEKSAENKGKYYHPQAFGKTVEDGINTYGIHKNMMR